MRTLVALLLAATLAPAMAAVVTFDSYMPRYNFSMTSIVTDGFSFTSTCACIGVDDQQPQTVGGDLLPGAYNGTASLLYSVDPLSIAAVGGASFYLDRLDLGLSYYVPDDQVGGIATLTLNLLGGGTSTIDVVLGRSYSTVVVGQDVLGLSISGGRSFGYVSLDNFVVNTIPEPESAGLALAALLGAGWATRRRAQASA